MGDAEIPSEIYLMLQRMGLEPGYIPPAEFLITLLLMTICIYVCIKLTDWVVYNFYL
jgi:hypothetical protein